MLAVRFRSMHTVNWHSWGMLWLTRDTYLSFLPSKSSISPCRERVSVKRNLYLSSKEGKKKCLSQRKKELQYDLIQRLPWKTIKIFKVYSISAFCCHPSRGGKVQWMNTYSTSPLPFTQSHYLWEWVQRAPSLRSDPTLGISRASRRISGKTFMGKHCYYSAYVL